MRKRDPRWLAFQEQQKQKQKQIQAEIKARAEKEKEQLRARAELFQEQAWTRVQEEEEEEDSGSDDNEDEEFECIICDKFFKSERQWKNHERSKKHLKAVEDIRLEMMHEENEYLGGGPSSNLVDAQDGSDVDVDEDEEAEELEMPKSRGATTETFVEDYQEESEVELEAEEEFLSEPESTPIYSALKSKKKNKKKKVMTTGHDFDEEQLEAMDQDGLADLLGSVRLSRAPTPSRGSKSQKNGNMDSDDDLDGATPLSTAPVSRAESPDGQPKAKKMSGKEKKKARSEAAAKKVTKNNSTHSP